MFFIHYLCENICSHVTLASLLHVYLVLRIFPRSWQYWSYTCFLLLRSSVDWFVTEFIAPQLSLLCGNWDLLKSKFIRYLQKQYYVIDRPDNTTDASSVLLSITHFAGCFDKKQLLPCSGSQLGCVIFTHHQALLASSCRHGLIIIFNVEGPKSSSSLRVQINT